MNITLQDKITQLKESIAQADRIAFLGGAGVSTESGIPDFRSADGLYQQQQRIPPEEILSHTFFVRNTQAFYQFYWKHMLYPDAKPNVTHYGLAQLEKQGILRAVITQNIDGLHQKAGSNTVYELHGSVYHNHCMACGQYYPLEEILGQALPRCKRCGGIVKPDVVLYEEQLDNAVLGAAIQTIQEADMLIVGGTSLNVYPAAGLIRYFRGKHLVLINKSETEYDGYADLVIHDALGKVFAQLL